MRADGMIASVRPGVVTLAAVVAVMSVCGAAGAAGQEATEAGRFGEVVDVQLVNVEAWVTDAGGDPVLGLEADDFEVLEDGRPVEISYFSKIGVGRLEAAAGGPRAAGEGPSTAEPEAAAGGSADAPAHLVVYFDSLHLTEPGLKRLVKEIRRFLDSDLVAPERVLILRQERALSTEAGFGSDRDRLRQALERIRQSGTSGTLVRQEKRLIILRLQQLWDAALSAPSVSGNPCDFFMLQARREVESYGRMAVDRIPFTLRSLEGVASFLGGVPGVKTLIYVSDALETAPAQDLRQLAQQLCPGHPETSAYRLPETLNDAFQAMARSAAANRVTFHALQASGLSTDFFSSAEQAGSDFRFNSSIASGAIRQGERSGMSLIASETGGRAVFNKNSFQKDLVRIGEEMASYYSLAYTPPHGGDRLEHRIEVRIRNHPQLRVRHRRGYRDKGPEERLTDRLYSALHLGAEENPLAARLGAGAMRRVGKNKYALPLHVLIPAERLSFVPGEDGPLAGVTVEVAARDPERSKILRTSTSYEVAAPAGDGDPVIDLLLSVELEPGRYVLAVAVRDRMTQETSYVSTSVEIAPPGEAAAAEM